MKFAVLGTGPVGTTIAGKLVELGHEVMIGSRDAGSESAQTCAEKSRAKPATFADAAAFGEMVFNFTAGATSLESLEAAGSSNLEGKVLIDGANPLDPSSGMPPTLTVCNDDSLAEQIQRAFPATKVVKTLNTVNSDVMVDPTKVPGEHNLFLSGNDADAKAEVVDVLSEFGWPPGSVIDLGDISTARGAEMYVAFWLRLLIAGNYQRHFNIQVRRGPAPGGG